MWLIVCGCVCVADVLHGYECIYIERYRCMCIYICMYNYFLHIPNTRHSPIRVRGGGARRVGCVGTDGARLGLGVGQDMGWRADRFRIVAAVCSHVKSKHEEIPRPPSLHLSLPLLLSTSIALCLYAAIAACCSEAFGSFWRPCSLQSLQSVQSTPKQKRSSKFTAGFA